MENDTLLARAAVQKTQLQNVNHIAEEYGLTLTKTQLQSLIAAEAHTLRSTGRLELGQGVLPRLITAFCDLPFINRDSWADTLETLQELFYNFKNDLNDALSDDELVEAMHTIFHGRAQGSLEYLENMDINRLFYALRSDDAEDDDEDA